MCKPLKDIIAELEEKYSDKPLLYDLEERSRVVADFYKDVIYLFERFEKYEEEVKYVLEHNLDVNIITRSTLNLTLIMQHLCESGSDYAYAIELYMMDEYYEKIHDLWSAFIDAHQKMKKLFESLEDNNIFESELTDGSDVLKRMFYEEEVYDRDEMLSDTGTMQIRHEELEKMNGGELLICLDCLLHFFGDILWELKNYNIKRIDESLNKYYERNYLLYAKCYWPAEERNFRPHIIRQRLKGNVTIDALERLRDEAIHEFEYNTVPGRIWRDYSEDITQMAIQMKEQKLNEEQWKYFFSWVFKLDEYDRWIEELRNPPESEENKQKRERLLKTNKVFNLHPAKSKKEVDILLLYQFIESRFISDKMFIYEWYALHFFLRRNDLLLSCTIEDFEKQMNDDEWFGHVEKKCKANEINTYSFLNDKAPDVWDIRYKPEGTNKATKRAIGNLYKKYSNLEDTIDEIYAEE